LADFFTRGTMRLVAEFLPSANAPRESAAYTKLEYAFFLFEAAGSQTLNWSKWSRI